MSSVSNQCSRLAVLAAPATRLAATGPAPRRRGFCGSLGKVVCGTGSTTPERTDCPVWARVGPERRSTIFGPKSASVRSSTSGLRQGARPARSPGRQLASRPVVNRPTWSLTTSRPGTEARPLRVMPTSCQLKVVAGQPRVVLPPSTPPPGRAVHDVTSTTWHQRPGPAQEPVRSRSRSADPFNHHRQQVGP